MPNLKEELVSLKLRFQELSNRIDRIEMIIVTDDEMAQSELSVCKETLMQLREQRAELAAKLNTGDMNQ
jgi:predicted  nucleic acid-binding Zn-ribbon protein